MITSGSTSIEHVATVIEERLLLTATDPQVQADARLSAMLVRLVAEDFDRAADVLVTDRRELEPVLESCAAAVPEVLRREISARLLDTGCSLRISDLRVRSDRDLRVLARVHDEVADRVESGDADPGLLDLLWHYLDAFTARRRYAFAT